MPLTKIQSEILRLLAAHRDPKSDVAGSAPLNVNAPRYSGDIDVFHDREERVAQAAQERWPLPWQNVCHNLFLQ